MRPSTLTLLFFIVFFCCVVYSAQTRSKRIAVNDIVVNQSSVSTTTLLAINSPSPGDDYPSDTPLQGATTTLVTHVPTPEHVKALYMSSWVAGTPSLRNAMVKIAETTEVNAIVIDVKDNTGVITWESRMKDLDSFIQELHSKNIYVIARIACFQDPLYVKAHPEQAVLSYRSGGVWQDRKGVPWVDTGSKEMWKYIESLGKEAYAKGFDEINLDYIRFPTDGKLSDMKFPISGTTSKPLIVGQFYYYITNAFRREGIPVSGDVFGIITTNENDVPVLGQDFHVALATFDFVAPMVYPSHYSPGTFGFAKPAEHPGGVIREALSGAIVMADEVASSTSVSSTSLRAKIRPWYQDFNMGAVYTKELVRSQIDQGESLGVYSWMLWDPANTYTIGALKP